MKKQLLTFTLLFICAGTAIMSCSKKQNTSPTDVMFYLSTNCGAGPDTIRINGQSTVLTYVFTGSVPNCGDPNTASFELPAGAYTYTVSDSASTRSGSVSVAANTCYKVAVSCDSFSTNVRNTIPEYFIDSLENWGMTINAGLTPPANLNGIYLFSPCIILYDGTYNYAVGSVFEDYHFRLSNQNQLNNSIDLAYKGLTGNDSAIGIGAYVSGNNNSFSIFGQVSSVGGPIAYTEVYVLSGIITSTGIENMQYAFMFTSKTGDYNNTLIPVGVARIFHDGDYFSGTSSTFRLAAPHPTTTGSSLPMFGSKK